MDVHVRRLSVEPTDVTCFPHARCLESGQDETALVRNTDTKTKRSGRWPLAGMSLSHPGARPEWACTPDRSGYIFDIQRTFHLREASFVYNRKLYLDRIGRFLGKPVVKAITGIRRVGKSYLLRQIIDQLHQEGTPQGISFKQGASK